MKVDIESPLDLAWYILRAAIDEAEDRYGLTLHGRVEYRNAEITLDFACAELNRAFRQQVDRSFLQHKYDADLFVEFGIYPSIRKLAEERDAH